MRFARTYVAVFLSLVLAIPLLSQQPATQSATSSPQALALLQKSLVVLTGGQALTDVTLSGTARRIAGSDDESGTVSLKALSTGESRMDLTFPSSQRSEIRANSSNGPVGAWSGTDGALHPISQHNLATDSSWFFPAFTLSRIFADPSYVVFYVDHETRNGQAVEHLTVSRQVQATGAPSGWVSPLPGLSKTDIYLDSTTYLPAAVVFNTHPDQNQNLNIPVEIRLSSYQQTNGVLIPLRIQHYLNNGLALDLQLTALTPNSGISASAFNVQ